MDAHGWIRLSAPGNKCATHWRHVSGWEVHHCGHPTANWPYYLTAPESGREITSFNALGFKTLAVAKIVVHGLLAGMFHLAGNHVQNATALGNFPDGGN